MINLSVEEENNIGLIKKASYVLGYVAAIDILGFSDYSCKENNYYKIRSLMNLIFANKKMFENNFDHIKFNICSDTIFVTVEVNDQKMFDYVYFQSVIEKIGYIRSEIFHELGLLSRAGITFGKYISENIKSNIIFGPAIVRAIMLAEHMDKIYQNNKGVLHEFKDRPAAIIIDNCFINHSNQEIRNKLIDGGVKDYILGKYYFEHIGANFYIYNAFYMDYLDRNERNNMCDKEYSINDYKGHYIKKSMTIISNIKETHPEKVIIEERLLSNFILNKYY